MKKLTTVVFKLNIWALLALVIGLRWIAKGVSFVWNALTKTSVKKTTKKRPSSKKKTN